MKTHYLTVLSDLANRYGLSAIYAFGSRGYEAASRIQGHPVFFSSLDSDLDIGVQTVKGRRLSVKEKVEISLALEDLFDVKRVDLVVLEEAKPFLALDIIKGELIYCDDFDRQAEEELYVLRRAGDLAYHERERRRLIFDGENQ